MKTLTIAEMFGKHAENQIDEDTEKKQLIWKARNEINPLGEIFQASKSKRLQTLSTCIPGHSEAASNNLANIWNQLDLKTAKSAVAAKAIAKKHLKSS